MLASSPLFVMFPVLVLEFAAEFKRKLTHLREERYGTARRLVKDLQQVERELGAVWTPSPGVTATLVRYAISYGSSRLER
jgi:hypothetical protein